MARFQVKAVDPSGHEHVKESASPYGWAVLYRMEKDKYLADRKRSGSTRGRCDVDRMEARGAFGVWRLAGLCESQKDAHDLGRQRATDWGVKQIWHCRTEVVDTRPGAA